MRCEKKQFSKREAEYLKKKGIHDKHWRVYLCPECFYYHLTSQNPNDQKYDDRGYNVHNWKKGYAKGRPEQGEC